MSYTSINTILLPGDFFRKATNAGDSFALNRRAILFRFSEHFRFTPLSVLRDGKHPTGTALNTAILRAPSPYSFYIMI